VFNRDNFIPISAGAINGNLKNFLAFQNCSFDETSTDVFGTMFAPNSNLRGLRLDANTLLSFSNPAQSMLAKILNKDSPLKKLSIELTDNAEGGIMMSAIMIALESNTTLHFLQVGGIDDRVRAALETGLPKLQGLRELDCDSLQLVEAQRPAMLETFKRNTSIRKTWGVEEAFPDIIDKKKLRHYATRNENIPLLLENPNRVPLSAWPKIFVIAQQSEYDSTIIFSALQKLAGHICQENRPRKRRRPDCV
jgi:hypothetical protein